uniref:Protein phosphatase 1 regulatory subunit 35 C-terminal domain-containing protein n=1 Tax=Anopheles culicifacies TaxID=139723 RepID=A0A182MRK4_9DIPT
MGKHKHGNRKRYLSNVDVPLSRSSATVLKSSTGDNGRLPPLKSILKLAGSTADPSQPQVGSSTSAAQSLPFAKMYSQADLHTLLALSKQIDTANKVEPQPITSMSQLTPSSKKRVNAQITKQLNHQYDQAVFQKLAPVNVNDTALLPAPGSRTAANAKSKYLFKDEKDPEPVLSDYLRPIPRFTVDFAPNVSTLHLGRVTAGDTWNNFHNIEYVLRIMEEH